MQKPTIGRIVIFTPSETDFECVNNRANEVPAIITRVFSDSCVNLRVITDGNSMPWKTSVSYSEDPEIRNTWRWPSISK